MNLLVDIGNSRVKWAQYSSARLHSFEACFYDKADISKALRPSWSRLGKPEGLYLSNVGGKHIVDDVTALASDLWGIKPNFLSVKRVAAGVSSAYEQFNQLGIDRWLAMIAAWNSCHSQVCVVDCGTAMTIDVVAASGQHLGGYIVPGLALMAEVLNRQTQQIDAPLNPQPSLALGRNTIDCISNGSLLSITSLITQVNKNLTAEHGTAAKCIITGGHAEYVQAFLEPEYIHVPHLVLDGIAVLSENLK